MILLMVFLHILDDFCLQGILASMKQKEWWKENAPGALYKYDYLISLFIHSYSWTFMIMLPYAMKMRFHYTAVFIICFVANVLIHSIVDDLKANRHKINLWIDQSIHFLQILITYLILSNIPK